MDWTLDHQQPDGAIGPVKNLDWWPNYVMLKALMQYQEASGDARVIPLMEKYFAYQARHMDERPLKEWAIFRWHDEVLSVLWLYNRNGDRALLDLARKLHTQGHDWEAQFANFRTKEKVPRSGANLSTHGVNNAMAMKAAAVWWLVTGEKGDRDSLYQMLDALDRYHGQPSGIFSADEHYAGRDPSQGTELCAVVEAMFSLETDMAILGDAAFGDRLEKIAYNALPATLSADLWAHQYDQQANQVMCSISNRRWATNGPESNIFGLEPNFGCCTANMHQGWPKLAANLWMATPDGGLAAVVYGPSEVTTTVRGGTAVTVEEVTDYPFREAVSLEVKMQGTARFPLALRIPAWAGTASVTVNGQPVDAVKAGRVPAHRTRVEECGSRGTAFPHDGAHLHLVQQFDLRGTRPAGLLAEDRRKLAQDQADRPVGGLGSLPHHAVELRAGERRISGNGEGDGAPAVHCRRVAGGDHREGAAPAAMDAGGRFARRVAGESGDHQARRRDGDAGALRRREAAHHGVPVARVEDAGKSSPQMYLLNQS